VDETLELLRRLQQERFFGSVTVKFEAGRVVHIKLEKNIKPDDLSGTPRNNHGTQLRS
jgi:hypothetical protein